MHVLIANVLWLHHSGALTPAQTLDLISTKNYLLIDIRSEKDKDKAGIPRLPSSAKSKLIAIPWVALASNPFVPLVPLSARWQRILFSSLEELPSKLKGLVRNVKKVEAEIAALKIAYLKRVNKGTNIVILDSWVLSSTSFIILDNDFGSLPSFLFCSCFCLVYMYSYSDSGKLVARALTNLGFKNTWIVADGFSGNKGWLQSRLGTDSYNFSFAEVISPSRIIPAATRRFGTTVQSGRKLLSD